MAIGWRRSKDGYWFRNTPRGKMMAHRSKTTPGRWIWDASQDQPDPIVPDTHRRNGSSATLKAAKEAAEHALSHMIKVNQ